MKFDLKGWKKHKEDKDFAHLKNEQGHELRIAKKALSPKMRGMLAQLSDGGMAGDSKPKPSPSPDSQKTLGETIGYPGSTEVAKREKRADGGMIGYADGGEAPSEEDLAPYLPSKEEENASGFPPGPERARYMATRKYRAAQAQNKYEGGGVQPTPKPSPSPDLSYTGSAFPFGSPIDNLKEGLGLAKRDKKSDGGEVRNKYADAGLVSTDDDQSQPPRSEANPQSPVVINIGGGPQGSAAAPQQAPAATPTPQDPPMAAQIGQVIGKMLHGSPPLMALGAAAKGIPAAIQGIGDVGQGIGSGLTGEPLPPAQPDAPSSLPPSGDIPNGTPPGGPPAPGQAPQAPPSDPYGAQKYEDLYQEGSKEKEQGIRQEAAARSALGAKEHEALSNQIQSGQKAMADYQQHVSDLNSEREQFISDVNNQHIDPNHYLGSQNWGQMMSTAVGLILGGFGAGVNGGQNPALSFINSQIERDIDAQKAELGKKETLLNANAKQFGNIRDAVDMTRLMMSDLVSNKMKDAIAQTTDQAAKAKMTQQLGDWHVQSAPIASQIAMRKTLSTSSAGGNIPGMVQMYRMMGNEPMAKDLESRYVPGMGVASIPVSQEVRDKLVAKQGLDTMARDFYNWASKNSGSLDPTVINEGKTKAAELQSLYRNSINGGVFKKGEQDFIDNIIDSNPTKFFNNIRVLPKLHEVIKNNQSQLNILKKGYGLQIPAPIKERKI